jgi:hypothetical protein
VWRLLAFVRARMRRRTRAPERTYEGWSSPESAELVRELQFLDEEPRSIARTEADVGASISVRRVCALQSLCTSVPV